jgi:small subunit ribosomal protein S4
MVLNHLSHEEYKNLYMQIKSKYKIARRVGAPIFEKTQTQKFAMREVRRGQKVRKHPSQKTDYGLQMLEKQKARFTYLMSERQFGNYVAKATAKKGAKPAEVLYGLLESRLDNVVYRMGLVNTRLFAKQIVNHGHIRVNNKKVDIPSFQVSLKDKISIREGSLKKKMFADIDEKLKTTITNVPSWIKMDIEKKSAEIQGAPKLDAGKTLFNIDSILEFYSR